MPKEENLTIRGVELRVPVGEISDREIACLNCCAVRPRSDYVIARQGLSERVLWCKECLRKERLRVAREKKLSSLKKEASRELRNIARVGSGVYQLEDAEFRSSYSRVIDSALRRLHKLMPYENRGRTPPETFGRLIADYLLELRSEKTKFSTMACVQVIKMLSEMMKTRHQNEAAGVDISKLTDGELDHILAPIAIQRLRENPQMAMIVLSQLQESCADHES